MSLKRIASIPFQSEIIFSDFCKGTLGLENVLDECMQYILLCYMAYAIESRRCSA